MPRSLLAALVAALAAIVPARCLGAGRPDPDVRQAVLRAGRPDGVLRRRLHPGRRGRAACSARSRTQRDRDLRHARRRGRRDRAARSRRPTPTRSSTTTTGLAGCSASPPTTRSRDRGRRAAGAASSAPRVVPALALGGRARRSPTAAASRAAKPMRRDRRGFTRAIGKHAVRALHARREAAARPSSSVAWAVTAATARSGCRARSRAGCAPAATSSSSTMPP